MNPTGQPTKTIFILRTKPGCSTHETPTVPVTLPAAPWETRK